jgi:hypothetical protein
MNGYMDGWVGGWLDVWMDGKVYRNVDKQNERLYR